MIDEYKKLSTALQFMKLTIKSELQRHSDSFEVINTYLESIKNMSHAKDMV